MQLGLLLCALFAFAFTSNAVVLKSTMSNQYPQVAVLGCDSRKANLYYDIDRRAWIEHLASPCVNNEQSILEFCQQAYPSLRIGNIVRLDTVLSFEDWCELTSPIDKNGNNIHRCKKVNGKEETVQPFRCLYMNSDREVANLPPTGCSINSIIGSGECYRSEKWQELASEKCINESKTLNHSIMTMDWCGLSLFRGIEFICCSKEKITDNDYETILGEQDDNALLEDDQVADSIPSHRRIIAMNLATREPKWIEDYRRWSSDPAYFADDEDTNDKQPGSSSSPSDEQIRFSKVKDEFKLNYKNKVDQLRARWQQRQDNIQSLILRDASEAEKEQNRIEQEFNTEYESIKQMASLERTRLNEVHENFLDSAMNKARSEANKKLNQAWNERPLKTERIQDALYNYLQLLLRDRIHLVNRYERLKAVDPNQAEKKRVPIHERLRLIADRINEALAQLKQNENLQTKIQPRIDSLFVEFDEVNRAGEKLLSDYLSTSTTTLKNRILPLGRDAAKIYPFRSTSSATTTVGTDDTNNEYDYATNDEYDEDDDDNETDLSLSTSTRTTVSSPNENDSVNYDQGESDWDTRNDNDENEKNDAVFDDDLIIDDQNQQAFINENDDRTDESNKRPVRHYLVTYLPYGVGCLFLICIFVGLLIFRFIKNNRAYGNRYEKNYVFTEVDSCTPDEKALHALQMNGYENPTYKYFESQTGKC